MITLGDQQLTLGTVEHLLRGTTPVTIGPKALQRVQHCYDFLKNFAADKVIYGINTGFGPMAQYKIDDHKRIALQYNLIRSHCTGMGEPLAPHLVRAAMVCQLNTLLLGKSGVVPEVPQLIITLLNEEIYPVIYEHGGVGASGDLVQLAHLALGYIGEGEVWYRGERRPCSAVFKEKNIAPLQIQLREGLSLMNGTSVMTGTGLVNAVSAKGALGWSLLASALLNEVVHAYNDHFSKPLNHAKQHSGQQYIAAVLRRVLSDSQCLENRQEHLYKGGITTQVFEKKVQEYYSLRCLPQVLGPIYDTLQHSTSILEREANSVNDNPIIDVETQNVYHGGNFHGDYVSLSMDHLRLAMTKLSMLAERQLNFLLNHHINGILPPFVNLGELGFNFGVQGAQFTATSTTAENQMLSSSMYVHSIPNNNDNQDIVSMGTNASTMTRRVIDNTYQVLAIEFMALVQAIEYLGLENQLSSYTGQCYQQIKASLPPFVEDAPLYQRLNAFKHYLQQHPLDVWETQPNSVSVD